MTNNNSSSTKGDRLTFVERLRSALAERSDGHGGEIFGVGASGQAIDLVGIASVTVSQLHFA